VALRLADEPVDLAEAEPCPFPDRLGRKKGLKCTPKYFRGHSLIEGSLPPLAIPTTLHASLLARLDRLASVRHIAQIGAAFGRWFRYTSVRAVCDLPEDELQAALTRLVASELVFQSGTPPDAVYTFKHALVQEAAYGSLLRNTRRQLHGRIAEALETLFPQLMESQPELFARHYTEAGLVEKSVFHWSKAARRSAARSAMAEAAAQFQKGLDQLTLLPDGVARRRQELELLSSLATVLQSVKGYAAPETGQTLARARELWEQLGSPSEFLQVSYAESLYHEIRGELNLAHRLDKDLLRLSRERNDPAGLVLAHQSLGRNLMFAGRLASSRSHLKETISLCDSDSRQSFCPAGRRPPSGRIASVFGDCAVVSRSSRSSIDAEHRSDRRSRQAGSSAVFGCGLDERREATFVHR
jgi:hypothetical protein